MRHAWRLAMLAMVAASAACSGYDGRPSGTLPAGESSAPSPSLSPSSDHQPIDLVRGKALYAEQCRGCHGSSGQGGGGGPALNNTIGCPACSDFHELWRVIDETMPFRSADSCDARCARDIAAWITNAFSTEPSCAVAFEYTAITMTGFSVDVRIHNARDRDVEAWSLAWTPDPGQRITAVNNGVVKERAGDILLEPDMATMRIVSGEEILVGIEGIHEGLNTIPDDLRLEAPPCFAAAPESPPA